MSVSPAPVPAAPASGTNTGDAPGSGLVASRPSTLRQGMRFVGPWLIALGLAALMQWFIPGAAGPYYNRLVLDAGIAMLLAVSLNYVNGLVGQFSIGHAGLMTLGGYAAGLMTYYGAIFLWGSPARVSGWMSGGEWLFAAACLFGGLVAAAAGYVVGLPSLRLRGDYLAIVTLGFGEILRVILQRTNPVLDDAAAVQAAGWNELVPPPVGGAIGFDGLPKYTNLFWVYLCLAVTVLVAYRIKRSGLGRAMLAVREDETAAQASGVHVTQVKVLAFVVSAFFAGVAGGLYAHESGVILSPKDAGFQRSFDLIIMTVLGGRGSISGVMLAAIILTVLPETLRSLMEYRLAVFALLLIVMMLVRPQGLFGSAEIWDFWRGRRRREPAP